MTDWYEILDILKREGVGTSKIRTSKGQNVESFFKDDQNVERSERQKFEKDQNVESQIRLSTFWFYLWHQKKSERQKSKRATTYGVLPMCSKACGGLG